MRVWRIIVGAAAIAVGGGAGWYFLRAPQSVEVCESFLVEQLKSPSSYKRIAYDVFASPIKDAADLENSAVLNLMTAYPSLYPDRSAAEEEYAKRRASYERRNSPQTLFVSISYDAANSFGASIRGQYECLFLDLWKKGEPSGTDLIASGEGRREK